METLRTYLLRRRILRLTQGKNKFFPTLGLRLDEVAGHSDPASVLTEQLSSAEYALRMPNDVEVSAQLRSMNFYNLGRSASYPRLLLSMVEEHLTKARPNWDDKNLQLEHIMPQTLSAPWLEMLGEDAEQIQQEWLNNIGNITLIRHNQQLGNKSFPAKKALYESKSGLQVTQNKTTDREVWARDEIERRRDYLVDLLVRAVLPIAEHRRRASNWRQTSKDGFDSRRVLRSLVGETIYFVDDERVTARVLNDSMVEFQGERYYLSPLVKELKQRRGNVSPSAAYQGASYWTWGGTRLVDL